MRTVLGMSLGPPTAQRPVGGAAVLASYLEAAADQADGPAFIIHAGDHVGASPPNSALLVANDNGKQILLTQAFSVSTAYDDIDLSISRAIRDRDSTPTRKWRQSSERSVPGEKTG